MISSALLAFAWQAGDSAQSAHPLDLFMRDVTEACILPDLEKSDPRLQLAARDWVRDTAADVLKKRIMDKSYSVSVEWPASKKAAASCSFDSEDVVAADVYDWFRKRIGEPQAIAWSRRQIGGWKMNINTHDAGVYVSRKHTDGSNRVGMMLHILQN